MTFGEFQRQSRRTQNAELNHDERLQHALYGLASEVGEIHGIYQKRFQGHAVDRDKVIEELGDLLYFAAELADCVGVGLDEVAARNVDKLWGRYPHGFDADRSLHRDDVARMTGDYR
jgi:NTP pyrophosphatase (non-canonical NTP hydrolase)